MPELTLVLPHWVYWAGLLVFPVCMLIAVRRTGERLHAPPSLLLAYFFLIVGGFIGIHRLYLKSRIAAVFIIAFIALIAFNHEARQARNQEATIKIEVTTAQFFLKRAIDDEEGDIPKLEQDLQRQEQVLAEIKKKHDSRESASRFTAAVILALLIADAFLLPWSFRRRVAAEINDEEKPPPPPKLSLPMIAEEDIFSRTVGKINKFVGEFCCYWTLIAVFVFYYEVIARYVFNSPTNWAHESMFLMFGMQYILVGGYCLRENAHVRVDVLYLRLSRRGKAMADVATSFFFFVFVVALMISGWIFFYDSFAVKEVSFTEWSIAYWPIKFALPLGALLLILQGIAGLIADIKTLINPASLT